MLLSMRERLYNQQVDLCDVNQMRLLLLLGDDEQIIEQKEVQRSFILLAQSGCRLTQLRQRTFLHQAPRVGHHRYFLHNSHTIHQ